MIPVPNDDSKLEKRKGEGPEGHKPEDNSLSASPYFIQITLPVVWKPVHPLTTIRSKQSLISSIKSANVLTKLIFKKSSFAKKITKVDDKRNASSIKMATKRKPEGSAQTGLITTFWVISPIFFDVAPLSSPSWQIPISLLLLLRPALPKFGVAFCQESYLHSSSFHFHKKDRDVQWCWKAGEMRVGVDLRA